jgi:hypothetical protein
MSASKMRAARSKIQSIFAQRNKPGHPFVRRLGVPVSPSGRSGKGKYSCPVRNRTPIYQLAAGLYVSVEKCIFYLSLQQLSVSSQFLNVVSEVVYKVSNLLLTEPYIKKQTSSSIRPKLERISGRLLW